MKPKYITRHSKNNNTNNLSCQDCWYNQHCENDCIDNTLCAEYEDGDGWNEVSYARYTETILTWQYDEYSNGDWMWDK